MDELEKKSPLTILFDEDCTLCRNLAALAARNAGPELTFVGWQTFTGKTDEKPEALGLWDGETMTSGPSAWEALITRHPALSALGWAASRLNLTKKTSEVFSTTSIIVRKLCTRCGRPEVRKSPQ